MAIKIGRGETFNNVRTDLSLPVFSHTQVCYILHDQRERNGNAEEKIMNFLKDDDISF